MTVQWIDGKPHYPGGSSTYRRDVAERDVAKEQEALKAKEARRREVIKAEDAAYDARQAALREAHEAAAREKAEAEVATKRAEVEADARRSGVPAHLIKSVTDAAMVQFHTERAKDVAERGDRVQRELRAFFARKGAPSFG